jgi:hypothetical protein
LAKSISVAGWKESIRFLYTHDNENQTRNLEIYKESFTTARAFSCAAYAVTNVKMVLVHARSLLLFHLISASTSSRFFLFPFFSVCCLVAPSSLAAARFFFSWLYVAKMLYHKIKSSKITFLKDFQ